MPNPDAQWSHDLRQATKVAVEEWAMLHAVDHLCFKHISLGFGVIDFSDLMRCDFRMIVRDTEKRIIFANADERIAAGRAID